MATINQMAYTDVLIRSEMSNQPAGRRIDGFRSSRQEHEAKPRHPETEPQDSILGPSILYSGEFRSGHLSGARTPYQAITKEESSQLGADCTLILLPLHCCRALLESCMPIKRQAYPAMLWWQGWLTGRPLLVEVSTALISWLSSPARPHGPSQLPSFSLLNGRDIFTE